MLSKASKEDSSCIDSVYALFEADMIDGTERYEYSDVKLAVERYHKGVTKQSKNSSKWGGNVDALLYSILTGIRVVVVMNGNKGLNEIVDTKKALERYARMSTKKRLEIPNWRNEEVSYLYFHAIGEATTVSDTANHYAALIPKPENRRPRNGWVFFGGYNEPQKINEDGGYNAPQNNNEDNNEGEEKVPGKSNLEMEEELVKEEKMNESKECGEEIPGKSILKEMQGKMSNKNKKETKRTQDNLRKKKERENMCTEKRKRVREDNAKQHKKQRRQKKESQQEEKEEAARKKKEEAARKKKEEAARKKKVETARKKEEPLKAAAKKKEAASGGKVAREATKKIIQLALELTDLNITPKQLKQKLEDH
jgi:hypothetical protein